jgi:predicted nucleic acid-binding protein
MATEAVRQEVMEYAPILARKRGLDLADVQAAVAAMLVEWQGALAYSRFRERALEQIGHRDPDDWPTVALALALALPIWSQDKDLDESGVRVYTTGQLLDELRRERESSHDE